MAHLLQELLHEHIEELARETKFIQRIFLFNWSRVFSVSSGYIFG
jgi:hypothetical protein